jgi:aromatic-L-amino-acid decarboxylase
LLASVNATGRVHLTHTRVAGRYTLRLAVGSPQTTEAHIDEAWALLSEAANTLLTP